MLLLKSPRWAILSGFFLAILSSNAQANGRCFFATHGPESNQAYAAAATENIKNKIHRLSAYVDGPTDTLRKISNQVGLEYAREFKDFYKTIREFSKIYAKEDHNPAARALVNELGFMQTRFSSNDLRTFLEGAKKEVQLSENEISKIVDEYEGYYHLIFLYYTNGSWYVR